MQDILLSIVTSAVTTGICAYVIQSWFQNQLAMQLETHRSELTRQNELQIAEFRHKLELAATERQITASLVLIPTRSFLAGQSLFAKLPV